MYTTNKTYSLYIAHLPILAVCLLLLLFLQRHRCSTSLVVYTYIRYKPATSSTLYACHTRATRVSHATNASVKV